MSFGPLPITLISDYCDCFSSSGLDLSARGQASPSSCLSKTLSASTTLAEKHFLNCTEGGSPRCSIRGRFQDTLHCPCSSRLLLLPRQLRNYQIRRKGTRYRLEGGWGGDLGTAALEEAFMVSEARRNCSCRARNQHALLFPVMCKSETTAAMPPSGALCEYLRVGTQIL